METVSDIGGVFSLTVEGVAPWHDLQRTDYKRITLVVSTAPTSRQPLLFSAGGSAYEAGSARTPFLDASRHRIRSGRVHAVFPRCGNCHSLLQHARSQNPRSLLVSTSSTHACDSSLPRPAGVLECRVLALALLAQRLHPVAALTTTAVLSALGSSVLHFSPFQPASSWLVEGRPRYR